MDDFEFGLFAVEFNNTVRRDCFNINVICDDIAEQNERFLVFVFSIFASDVSPHAVADPSTAVLTITDVSLSSKLFTCVYSNRMHACAYKLNVLQIYNTSATL